MKILVNELSVVAEDGVTVKDMVTRFKPNADVFILNSFPVESHCSLCEGDRLVLIAKGKRPGVNELESMLAARHTVGVYEKLKNSSVAIAGVGGLGSHAAVTLARMGVGKITIVDYDVVEPSNLNRQVYSISQLGMKKVDALKATLIGINPYLEIEAVDRYVEDQNIAKIFNGYNVIIEGFDLAENKALFISAVLTRLPDSFIIGASGIAGYCSASSFTSKRIGKMCVIIGDFEREATLGEGLMASRVSIAGNIQANIAIRYLLGEYI